MTSKSFLVSNELSQEALPEEKEASVNKITELRSLTLESNLVVSLIFFLIGLCLASFSPPAISAFLLAILLDDMIHGVAVGKGHHYNFCVCGSYDYCACANLQEEACYYLVRLRVEDEHLQAVLLQQQGEG